MAEQAWTDEKLRIVEQVLAEIYAEWLVRSCLVIVQVDEDGTPGWFDRRYSTMERTEDERALCGEALAYLEARGLLETHPCDASWVRVLDEAAHDSLCELALYPTVLVCQCAARRAAVTT